MMLAGWINRHQQDMIEYLKAENKTSKKAWKNEHRLIDLLPQDTGKIIRQDRLGGLLKFYRRAT
jgi:hypothetical protein